MLSCPQISGGGVPFSKTQLVLIGDNWVFCPVDNCTIRECSANMIAVNGHPKLKCLHILSLAPGIWTSPSAQCSKPIDKSYSIRFREMAQGVV